MSSYAVGDAVIRIAKMSQCFTAAIEVPYFVNGKSYLGMFQSLESDEQREKERKLWSQSLRYDL